VHEPTGSASLSDLLAGYRQDHPEVVVRTVGVRTAADVAVVEASKDAGMVVVTRPHLGQGRGAWERSLARSLSGVPTAR
jgi:hypothetical protein